MKGVVHVLAAVKDDECFGALLNFTKFSAIPRNVKMSNLQFSINQSINHLFIYLFTVGF